MKIVIPSRSRAERLAKGLMTQIPQSLWPLTRVIVDEDQYADYRARLPEAVRVTNMGLQSRIALKRLWTAQFVHGEGFDTFFMLDDDIQFLIRKSDDNWQLTEQTPSDFFQMYMCISEIFSRDGNISHIGISAREGNNRVGVGAWDAPNMIASNTRTMRAVAWRTADFLAVEHLRTEVMEDFDVSLQSLRSGKSNRCLYFFGQGQRSTQEAGGCSEWRTHAIHEASARKLAELHPGLVSLRQKNNKTGGEFGTRTEVTIQWKKAAAS